MCFKLQYIFLTLQTPPAWDLLIEQSMVLALPHLHDGQLCYNLCAIIIIFCHTGFIGGSKVSFQDVVASAPPYKLAASPKPIVYDVDRFGHLESSILSSV